MPFSAYTPQYPVDPQRRIAVNDRVSVPDGFAGSVVGFYAGTPETVLVHLDSGNSCEYARADLRRLG